MPAKANLLEALQFYGIAVLTLNGKHVTVQNNFTIEAEANGIYKLTQDDYVIAPFDDLDELCRFILL